MVKVGEVVLCLNIDLNNEDKVSGCSYSVTLLGRVYWPQERFCRTSVLKSTSNCKPIEPWQGLIQSETYKSFGIFGVPAVPPYFPWTYLALQTVDWTIIWVAESPGHFAKLKFYPQKQYLSNHTNVSLKCCSTPCLTRLTLTNHKKLKKKIYDEMKFTVLSSALPVEGFLSCPFNWENRKQNKY